MTSTVSLKDNVVNETEAANDRVRMPSSTTPIPSFSGGVTNDNVHNLSDGNILSSQTNTMAEAPPQTAEQQPAVAHPLPAPPPPSKVTENDADLDSLSAMMTKFSWSDDAVESCAKAIMDPNGSESSKLKGIQQLKQLLCTSREHVFRIAQDVIESGVLRGLVHFVSSDNHFSDLRLPAAFCLTNIAAGNDEQTAAVVEAGAIPVFLELLRYRDESLRRQAIFCLANIAGSTPEFRKALADQPHYFASIIYAVVNATDPKVEELAGWNIRNMIVLGGSEFHQVTEGIDFFSEQLHRHAPPLCDCQALLVNGSASLNAVMNTSEFGMGHGSGCMRSPNTYIPRYFGDGFSHFHSGFANSPVLRFACETFSWISRHAEGRAALVANELPTPLLYHAKFNSNHSVRNHSLECLANLAQFGTRSSRHALIKVGATVALSELLADHITYSPHQRVMAARCLYWIAQESLPGDSNIMAEPSVVTREVARKLIVARREVLRRTIAKKKEAVSARQHLLSSRSRNLQSSTGIEDLEHEVDHAVADDDDQDDGCNGRRVLEDFVADIDDDLFFPGLEDGVIIGAGHIHIQDDSSSSGGKVLIPCVSTLEVAYAIFNQTERLEEFALREKCGRLLVSILLNVSENVILKSLSGDLFRLILDILEIAVDIDLQQLMSGGDIGTDSNSTSAVGTSSVVGGNNNAASAIDALRPGEPSLPTAAFVSSALRLLERLFSLGDVFRQREGVLENPVVTLFRQEDGPQRLEGLITKGPLPFELIQKTVIMIQTYCH